MSETQLDTTCYFWLWFSHTIVLLLFVVYWVFVFGLHSLHLLR